MGRAGRALAADVSVEGVRRGTAGPGRPGLLRRPGPFEQAGPHGPLPGFPRRRQFPRFPLALLDNLPLIMCVFIALFVAEFIAGEYRNGTLKLVLLRPISRTSLLQAKIISLFTFISVMIAFTVISAYITGTLAFGWGEQTISSSLAEVGITLQSALAMLLPALGFGVIVIFVSLLTVNVGATIGGALGTMILSQLLENIENVRQYSIILLMKSFPQSFIDDFSIPNILTGAAIIVAYLVIFYLGSLFLLRKKDVLS